MNPTEITPELVEQMIESGQEDSLRALLHEVLTEAFGADKAMPNETILLLNTYYELQNELMEAEIETLREALETKGLLDKVEQKADEQIKLNEVRKSME